MNMWVFTLFAIFSLRARYLDNLWRQFAPYFSPFPRILLHVAIFLNCRTHVTAIYFFAKNSCNGFWLLES